MEPTVTIEIVVAAPEGRARLAKAHSGGDRTTRARSDYYESVKAKTGLTAEVWPEVFVEAIAGLVPPNRTNDPEIRRRAEAVSAMLAEDQLSDAGDVEGLMRVLVDLGKYLHGY